MDQTSDQYLEFKQELQDVMAETVGEIKPELAEAFEWRTYVQRYPGTCLLAGGALGWILGRSLGSQSPPVPAQPKIQAFRILDVPKNGGQGGFLSFGRGVASNCREDEAILERDNSSSQRIAGESGAVVFSYASPKGRRGGICSDQGISGG